MDIRNITDRNLFEEFARRMQCSENPNKKVILVGPPGSGKGTQGKKLADRYCWCNLSTGDMLREAVSRKSELGKKVEKIMNKGDLVSDELMIDLIKGKINEPVCNFGVILDGFPRTMV